MPPVRFEPTFSTGERPQTYTLDRADTWTRYEVEMEEPILRARPFYPILLSLFSFFILNSHILRTTAFYNRLLK